MILFCFNIRLQPEDICLHFGIYHFNRTCGRGGIRTPLLRSPLRQFVKAGRIYSPLPLLAQNMDSRGFEPRLPDFDPASTIHLKSKIWGIFWKVSPAPLPTYVATFTNLKWGTRIKQVVLCRGGCGARTHKAILCTHWFSRPAAQPIHATLHCSPTKTRTWVRSLGNFRSIPLNYRAICVGLPGLEPGTSRVSGGCSNQLS